MIEERLRAVALLDDLEDGEIAWIAAEGRERRLVPGEHLFHQGDRAGAFHVVLDGRLETSRDVGGEQVFMFDHGPGGHLGAMAILTDTPYRGSTVAVEDTLVFELEGDELRRLAVAHPPLLRKLLGVVESVGGIVKRIEADREKLLTVGKLAAGLAHELNNPAAAAARGAVTLREYERRRQDAFAEIARTGAPAECLAALVTLGTQATDCAGATTERVDPLAESDREQELAALLEARGVDDPWDIASALTEARLGPEWVDRVAEGVGEAGLSAGLRFLGACAGASLLLAEVEEATGRVSALVDAFRSYSYMDQATRQTVDVHAGIENTLALLGHKLRDRRIALVRDLDPDLPAIEASGSELNQVWTNLLDNAIDAVGDEGRITLRTRRRTDRVMVEIGDDGPGIPPEMQARIFEAFVSTKDEGKGTGLGLDIARRIVTRHKGELRLESRPGDTRFQVFLPIG